MKTFRFLCNLTCHLTDGSTETLLNRYVVVEATDIEDARRNLHAVATELVHDRGSDWISAPLDWLTCIVNDVISPRDHLAHWRHINPNG